MASIVFAIASWLTFPVAYWTNRYFRLILAITDTFAFHTLNIHTQHNEQHIYTYTGTHKDIQTLLNNVTLKLTSSSILMLATCTVVSYIVFIIRVVKDMAQMLSGASSALDVFQRSGFESRLGRH